MKLRYISAFSPKEDMEIESPIIGAIRHARGFNIPAGTIICAIGQGTHFLFFIVEELTPDTCCVSRHYPQAVAA